MDYPYVDIHTHSDIKETGVVKIYSYLLENGGPLPDVPFSAGVHPWHAVGIDFNILNKFPAGNANLMAVGEIGLDYTAKNLNKERQTEWFRRQLSLAAKLNLSVIIHCVKAHNDLLHEVKLRPVKAVVIHGFTGSPELAKQMTDNGFYLSFGINSLRSIKTAEALKQSPPDKIFFETDDFGANIQEVYRQAAALMWIREEELKKAAYENYKTIFNEG